LAFFLIHFARPSEQLFFGLKFYLSHFPEGGKMSAIDVFVSLCLVAVLAYITEVVKKFLEDAKLLTINKYLAMIASSVIWWLVGASAGFLVVANWLKTGAGKVTLLNFDYWSFAAMTLTYCLVFYLAMTRRKTKPKMKKSK
jgi:hypothetical protein